MNRLSIHVAAMLVVAFTALPVAAAAPGGRPTVRLDVLYTSDIHGHLGLDDATFLNPEFPPVLGGGAAAAAYIRRARTESRAAGGTVLLFDSGDWFTGTPLGQLTHGAAVIDWMNRQRYDAVTIGNHDFDQGRAVAESLAARARFPVLAANVFDATTGARVDWARDAAWFEAGPIRIAVLGYITESTPAMSYAKNIEGLEFRPIVDMIEADARAARAGGAHLVFALVHQGLPWAGDLETPYRAMLEREAAGALRRPGMDLMELAHVVRGVDAYFGGHTHQGFAEPWEDPVTHALVFEPYGNGSSLGHVTFTIDVPTRQITGWDTHFDRGALLTLLEDDLAPDTSEYRILAGQTREAERGLDAVVGRTEVPLSGGPAESALLGHLVADAFREALGTDVAIQNTGGVRGRLRPGPITERDLMAVSPFGNDMVVMQVPGAMLRAIFEDKLGGGGLFVAGVRVRFDPSRPIGDRVLDVTVGAAPLDPERVYTVATTTYLAEGNSGLDRLRELPPEDVQPAGFTDLDVLRRYVREHSPLRPVNDGRWQPMARP